MARPLKYFLIILGLFVLAVVGALTAAVMTFDPNDYRARIAKLVHDKTSRDLQIGDIKLTVFPWLKVDLKQVSLSNAAGFGDQAFAKVGEAKVGVQLLPLLRDRKIVVDGVQLDGLVLNLAKSADGKTNWDDLAKINAKEPSKPEEPQQPSSFKLEDIDIGGIDIKDAAISYRDDQTHQSYSISDFDLKTGALKPGKAFDVETSIKAVLAAQKLDTEVKLSAHVDPDLKTQDLKLEDLKLEITAKNPERQADIKLSGEVSGNLGTQIFQTKDLKIAATGKNASIDGKADVKANVKADIKAKRYEIAGLNLDASASGKALPGGSQNVQLTGDVIVDQTSGKGEARGIVLKASGLEATTTLALSGLNGDTPHYGGPLTVKPFNARELLAKFSAEPLKTSDPKALTEVSFKSQIDGTAKSVKLNELLLKLDQTNLSGSISIRDFATSAVSFALRADTLDADRYLAPRTETPKEKVEKIKSADLNSTEIPVDALAKLDVDGTLDVAKLTLRGLKLSDVRLTLTGPKGAAKIASLNGKLYGGSFTSTTRIAPGLRPGFAFKTSLQSLALGPFLKDLSGKDKVDGIGTIELDLTSAGKTVGDLRKALNGTVALNFKNGAVKGFNLGEMLRRGQALLRGQTYTPSGEPPQTDFASIDFSGQIVNGILKSDTLDARNPMLRVGGAGQVDLVNETFDYTAKPTIVETSKGQGGRGLEDLGGVTVPVHLTGTFTDPKYKVQISDAVRARAKEEIKQQLNEHKDELKQKLNERLGPALDGLFGRRKKQQEPPPSDEQQKEQSAPTTP
ncbi:MAG: AsmA family protein [Hydrocarboniphaga sp.]|uniref:AsmA family protein n=1 Tax=Hydrocarboniphaga sp. TaxID=2033016 RepID=UPI00262B02D6|nr:AsmA family protein [Hydrocarboniphaga sp.]MDB5972095.1 AsmA family protein [Hydrocarboniphaga sp.]